MQTRLGRGLAASAKTELKVRLVGKWKDWGIWLGPKCGKLSKNKQTNKAPKLWRFQHHLETLGKEKQLAAVGGIKEEGFYRHVEMYKDVHQSNAHHHQRRVQGSEVESSRRCLKVQFIWREAGVWDMLFYFCSSLLRKAALCSPCLCPRVGTTLGKSDGRKEESEWHLPHWDIIRWFSVDEGSFGSKAITDSRKTMQANPGAATIWEGYRKSSRKLAELERCWKNTTRFEYIGRKTIPWKRNRCFCQFAGLRCQALREITLSQSPTPHPRNPECRGAVPSPLQEILTCS